MAGAVGIVFGLCVLSFTLGAALMYVLVRRREEAAQNTSAPAEAPVDPKWAERTWVDRPMVVEPVDADYETRSIHRNPVIGLPHLEPALAAQVEPLAHRTPERAAGRAAEPTAVLAVEPVVEPAAPAAQLIAEPVAVIAEPKTVGAARYDRDGDLDPPVGRVEAPESSLAASTDSPEAVAEAAGEPIAQPAQEPTGQSAQEPDEQPEQAPLPVTRTKLPPPASPQPAEHTTRVEREDFRQRYLRTFEEVRRRADSN